MSKKAFYEEEDDGDGYYAVTFLILESNRRLIRRFNDSGEVLRFVNRLKRSKKCRVLSYPVID